MTGDGNQPAPVGKDRGNRIRPLDLPTRPRRGGAHGADMRKLGDGPSQIVPHPADHPGAFGSVQRGQSVTEIIVGNAGNRQERTDRPRHRSTDIGCRLWPQPRNQGEREAGEEGFEPVAEITERHRAGRNTVSSNASRGASSCQSSATPTLRIRPARRGAAAPHPWGL